MLTRRLAVLALCGGCTAEVARPTHVEKMAAVSESRPGFTLMVEPAEVEVAPGGSATAKITVNRDFPFRRDVILSLGDLPEGITGVIETSMPGDGAASVTFTAAANASAGAASVVIRGEALGHVYASTAVQLTVQPPLMPISLDFCASDPAVWFAYQNDGGSWTRVQPDANGTVSFEAAERVGIVITRQRRNAGGVLALNYITSVMYVTAAQLQPLSGVTCVSEFGNKAVNGSVAGLLSGESAAVSLHLVPVTASAASTSFRATRKPDTGALDLIGVRRSSTGLPLQAIIRRGLVLDNEAVVPTLDFAGAEAYAVELPPYSVSGLRGSGDQLMVDFWTSAGPGQLPSYQRLQLRSGVAATGTFPAIPSALIGPTDRHELTIRTGAPQDASGVTEIFAAGSAKDLAIGPSLAMPVISQVSSSAGPLFTAALPAQAEYGGMARLIVYRFGNSVINAFTVEATAEYFGGTPATWTLAMPDFSAVEGWNRSWGYSGGEVLTPELHAWSAASVDIPPTWLDLIIPPQVRTFGSVTSVRFASRRLAITAGP